MNAIQDDTSSCQPRVLVVDNDPNYRQLFVSLLEHWGFIPVEAQGSGSQLIEDAIQKSKSYRCQLALVDMRLQFDDDPNDESGLELVPLLKPTESIAVSGFGDHKVAVKSIEKGALSFVGKEQGAEPLKEKVERAAARLCFARRETQITPQQIIDRVATVMLGDLPGAPKDEVEEVLARLFPEARQLEVEQLDQSDNPVTLSNVPRPGSAILKVREDGKQPVFVKLARAPRISQELDNYRKSIQGKLVGGFNPVLMQHAILWDLGGAMFTFLGTTDIKTFSEHYDGRPAKTIQGSLEKFFGVVWSDLYHKTRDQQRCSLLQAYCNVWGQSWYQKVLNFQSPDPAELMGNEIWQSLNAPCPVPWLIERVGVHDGNLAQSFVEEVVFGVTHGDLHGDNLLIDERDNAWVIDFERSGPGPILQDFVELEGDIINRLTFVGEGFKIFYALCIWVAKHEQIQGFDDLDEEMDPDLLKPLQVISTLRKLARQLTGVTDARQYLLGILFNTLFRATIITHKDDVRSQYRALMLASILCHRLEHWGEPWPPANWPPFSIRGG